ncbi:MAG: hypothetical protein ACLQCB_19700 [Spirochaetia bacterium]
MKSCRFLLDDGLQGAASCLSVALGCSVTVVDSRPAWARQRKRMVQVDMPALFYKTLESFASLQGASVETLLRSWIEEHARPTVTEEGKRIRERCRLLREWQGLGFAGKEPDLRYFAGRLADA